MSPTATHQNIIKITLFFNLVHFPAPIHLLNMKYNPIIIISHRFPKNVQILSPNFVLSNYICVLVHVCPSVQSRSTGGRQGPFNNSTWTIRGGVPLDDHKLSTTKMRKNEEKSACK